MGWVVDTPASELGTGRTGEGGGGGDDQTGGWVGQGRGKGKGIVFVLKELWFECSMDPSIHCVATKFGAVAQGMEPVRKLCSWYDAWPRPVT